MTPGFTIRIATPDDAEAVSALLDASYTAPFSARYDEAVMAAALPLMTRANPALLASGTYYVAQTGDGRLVGCGGWTAARPGTGEVVAGLGHVRHFGTHPEWTRRGVGRALFGRCVAAARAAGIDRFECYSSLVAEDFYRALGFSVVERREIELRPGVRLPGVLMAAAIG